MKILTLLEDFLIEISPEEIHQTYYKEIPYKIFYGLVTADPQTVVNGGKLIKIGRYAKILIRLWEHKHLKYEDFPKAKEYLTYAYKHNVPIPHNIRDLSDIYKLVQHYIVQDNPNFNTALSNLESNEYNLLYDGKDWKIYKPLTERASCYLGVSSEWCTTWGPLSLNPSHRERKNMFDYYSKNDPLYILINKLNPNIKYQFHFKSKQFMDVNDKQIDIQKFFSDFNEIRNFFFPSFIKDTSEEELRREMLIMSILSNDDRLEILRKLLDISGEKNILIFSIINENQNVTENLIHGKYLDDIEFYDNILMVVLSKITNDIEQVYNTLGYYGSERYNSDTLYYDLDGIDWDEELLPVFEEYYNKNKEFVRTSTAIHNFDTFKNNFFEKFYNDDNIQDEYRDKYIDLTSPIYNTAIDNATKEITDFIDINTNYVGKYRVSLAIDNFITYLLEKNIQKIEDISSTIDDYINENNIETEYYGIEYDREYPKYSDIENAIDTFFENLFENGDQCVEYREIFNNVISKIFNGKTEYENDHVEIKINSEQINCEKGTVNIDYWNKDKNTRHKGDVKVSNLATYALNYALFESIRTFKKNIL